MLPLTKTRPNSQHRRDSIGWKKLIKDPVVMYTQRVSFQLQTAQQCKTQSAKLSSGIKLGLALGLRDITHKVQNELGKIWEHEPLLSCFQQSVLWVRLCIKREWNFLTQSDTTFRVRNSQGIRVRMKKVTEHSSSVDSGIGKKTHG